MASNRTQAVANQNAAEGIAKFIEDITELLTSNPKTQLLTAALSTPLKSHCSIFS
jgi:hypothetical protein